MKRKILIICSLICVVLIASAAVFGSSLSKQVEIFFRNIKITIDGEEITPVDEDGDAVEPFIYNGTTYLPMRAVAEALGKNVTWDDATSTVVITSEPSQQENSGTAPVTSVNLAPKEGSLTYELEAMLETAEDKQPTDNNYVASFGSVPVSETYLRYVTIAANSFHDSAENEEGKALAQAEIHDHLSLIAAVINTAEEKGITITEEEFTAQVVPNINAYKQTFGSEYVNFFQSYAYQTPFAFYMSNFHNMLFDKLYEYYAAQDDFANDITQQVLEQLKQQDYIRAKHILICFPEGSELTDEVKAETLKKANDVMALVKEGKDFDELIKTYGEDPGMTQNPDGYCFTRGEMVEPFETAAYALKEGEYSEPVETSFGYHIILKLPLDEASARSTSLFSSAVSEKLNNMLLESAKDYEVVLADNIEELYNKYYEEYLSSLSQAE